MVVTRRLRLDTQGHCDLVDITDRVAKEVAGSGVRDGIVTVFVVGSTAAVGTNEFEPALLRDMKRMWDRLVPADLPYEHEGEWRGRNAHSHLRATLLGTSYTIPISGGKLILGTWQQIIFMDFDTAPRHREVVLQIMGE